MLIKERHSFRRDQFLQCPTAVKPLAVHHGLLWRVLKIDYAYLTALVPEVHAVDSLGQLARVPLVDAACFDPTVAAVLRCCQIAEAFDLGEIFLLLKKKIGG